jgi:hypothetical protein
VDHSYRQGGPDDIVRAHGSPAFSTRARVVCERCNGGWMSRLEVVCKPLLLPLVEDHRRTLDAFVHPPIATWAHKTAMTLAQTMPADTHHPPSALLRQLIDIRLPPAAGSVWLGRLADERMAAQFWPTRVRELDVAGIDAEGYWATLSVGQLVLQTFANTLPPSIHGSQVNLGLGPFADALIRIWPPQSGFVEWPPARDLDQASLEALALHFYKS